MLELRAENRDIFGKKLAFSRKEGKLPAVLYGPKDENRFIFVSLKDFNKIWQQAGESAVIKLILESGTKEVLIQEAVTDPVKGGVIHVDFYAAEMDKPIQANVPLVFDGVSPAVKSLGAILVKVLREVEIEALPKNLPHEITVDISSLDEFDDKILAKDIILPNGARLITDSEEAVVLVEAPKEEAAPAEEKIAFEQIEVVGKKEKEEEEAGEAGGE